MGYFRCKVKEFSKNECKTKYYVTVIFGPIILAEQWFFGSNRGQPISWPSKSKQIMAKKIVHSTQGIVMKIFMLKTWSCWFNSHENIQRDGKPLQCIQLWLLAQSVDSNKYSQFENKTFVCDRRKESIWWFVICGLIVFCHRVYCFLRGSSL